MCSKIYILTANVTKVFMQLCDMLLGRKECEEEERRAREDIEKLRLAEAAQLQQEEKQRQVIQEWVGRDFLFQNFTSSVVINIIEKSYAQKICKKEEKYTKNSGNRTQKS